MSASEAGLAAAARWRQIIEAEHRQTESLPDFAQGDHWQAFASRFRPDREAGPDLQLEALLRRIEPRHTVLDVGAGGGRLAIPLAQRCRHVTAVEPSPSMGEVLQESAAQAGVANLSLVPTTWEEARVEPADIVLCSHVLYTVADVLPFVRKLEDHARERVIVLLFSQPAIAHVAPFWKRVHGEPRRQLPALTEFVQLLWANGIYPDVEMLSPRRGGRFQDWEEARQTLRARLYIRPGTPEEERLEDAMRDLLEEAGGVLRVRGLPPQLPGLVTWAPESPRSPTP